jgi:putative transposase
MEFRPKISMRRSHAMAAGSSIDVTGWLEEQLAQASPDLLRSVVQTFAEALMGADVDAVCGAAYGERSGERMNTRNGYRRREWDTRAGSISLAIPKLRQGSYFPGWLLERRRRAEAALVTVVATSYLLGVSTRRMEKLVETLGITRLSKSQVSEMAKDLDAQVEAFRTRPLDAGPYTFVAADALVLKVREAGRIVNVHALLATGVNADGYREILGLHVISAEDGAGWLGFFRDLAARGLSGVALVTSDAHRGLTEAIGATLPGAAWQRCRTGSVALADHSEWETGSMTAPGSSSVFAGFRFPREVIAGRGPLVPALRAVLPGRRGTAGRARRHRRSRHHLPVGPAVHPRVHRSCPVLPPRSRRPLVR